MHQVRCLVLQIQMTESRQHSALVARVPSGGDGQRSNSHMNIRKIAVVTSTKKEWS